MCEVVEAVAHLLCTTLVNPKLVVKEDSLEAAHNTVGSSASDDHSGLTVSWHTHWIQRVYGHVSEIDGRCLDG